LGKSLSKSSALLPVLALSLLSVPPPFVEGAPFFLLSMTVTSLPEPVLPPVGEERRLELRSSEEEEGRRSGGAMSSFDGVEPMSDSSWSELAADCSPWTLALGRLKLFRGKHGWHSMLVSGLSYRLKMLLLTVALCLRWPMAAAAAFFHRSRPNGGGGGGGSWSP